MPPISWKKVLIVIGIVVVLAKFETIKSLLSHLGAMIYSSMDPLWQRPAEEKYVVAMLFYALIFIVVYKLIMKRRR